MHVQKVFPINLSNNISFALQVDDNVGAVPENNDSENGLSGQNGDLSPEGSLNKGYISISL